MYTSLQHIYYVLQGVIYKRLVELLDILVISIYVCSAVFKQTVSDSYFRGSDRERFYSNLNTAQHLRSNEIA